MKSTRNSVIKYLVIVFLILAVFAISASLFINFSKIPLLKSVNKIVQVQNDFIKLDSCIFKLYNAENSCRMYVVSGNKTYYNHFVTQIKEVSAIMDAIEYESQKEKALQVDNFNDLIQQKKIRTNQFIQLRKLADSLINFSVQVKDNPELAEPKNNLFTTRQFRSIVTIDTIKPSLKVAPRKKLFGRIFAAIGSRKSKLVDSSKSTLVKTAVSADTSSVSVAYNKLQLKLINDYYIKLYRLNKNLKDKEWLLLDLNHKLIEAIVNSLNKYKVNEKIYYDTVQEDINVKTFKTVDNLDKFTKTLLALAFGLMLCIIYSIYKLYRNEKALIDYSNKAKLYALSKSRFLANMSHEIRTPLNSIVGFSEQLTQVVLPSQQYEQVTAIRKSSIMLLEVVNDILDFSKYETGKVTIEKLPFSPQVAIYDVFDSMKIQADKKKLDFILDTQVDKNTFVLGDSLRLKQIVMNLLSNAIKFTNSGNVTLSAEFLKKNEKNLVLKVSVKDSGLGISAIDQKIIFDEFAQVYYASTKEKQQGTGLGLAICKKIVEFHGGNISLSSEEGKGSNFIFEIPYQITAKPVDIDNKLELTTAQLNRLVGKDILVADDNVLNILLATTILKKYRLNFSAASNGQQAFELFTENNYDLILTDIQMPELGGIELTKLIRSYHDELKRNIPILGVTANVMQEDRAKYLQSGMDELVLKPFSEKELLDKILKFI
ncbi:ATP-binding protein [Pedobacter aquatilis]|uniref:ATP-binding protein n=1 Tax=Pedobacter aquatilis TaxID=351343 RepID=UPI0025B2E9DC|nr:ATP-binding protein [Pedobacter aquatilis]MDN3587214.1 ATP-binding protein [Pedobacter aquatilis]